MVMGAERKWISMKQRILLIMNLSGVSALVILGFAVISPVLPQYVLSFSVSVAKTGWTVFAYYTRKKRNQIKKINGRTIKSAISDNKVNLTAARLNASVFLSRLDNSLMSSRQRKKGSIFALIRKIVFGPKI